MESLTPKQAQLLAFIKSEIAETNVAPSFEQMRHHMGIASKSGVHTLMTALEERGHIKRPKRAARRITVLS